MYAGGLFISVAIIKVARSYLAAGAGDPAFFSSNNWNIPIRYFQQTPEQAHIDLAHIMQKMETEPGTARLKKVINSLYLYSKVL